MKFQDFFTQQFQVKNTLKIGILGHNIFCGILPGFLLFFSVKSLKDMSQLQIGIIFRGLIVKDVKSFFFA